MGSKVFVESLESRVMLSAAATPLVALPSMVVQGQGVVIPAGDTLVRPADFTDFGPMSTSAGASTRRYIIKNTGTARLKIASISIAGLNPGDFTIIQQPTTPIAAGARGVFIVTFSPLAAGTRSAKVVINSNDPSTPMDKFAIGGTGLSTTTLADGLQYATTVPGAGRKTIANTFIAVNYTGYLLNGVMFDTSLSPGKSPLDFQIDHGGMIQGWNEGLTGMRPGEHRTLIIPGSLGYGAAGNPGAGIPGDATLIFETELVATGYLDVLGAGNAPIPSGTATPSTALGTEFGRTTVGHSVSRTFLFKTTDVQNVLLGLTTVNFSGNQSGQFSFTVIGSYDTVLGAWPVQITYKAGRVGVANVTVSIPNHDPRHPDYTFAIHGKTVA